MASPASCRRTEITPVLLALVNLTTVCPLVESTVTGWVRCQAYGADRLDEVPRWAAPSSLGPMKWQAPRASPFSLIQGQFQARNGSGELASAAPRPWLARQTPNDRPDVPAQSNSPPP
jgi:hypothetical protein